MVQGLVSAARSARSAPPGCATGRTWPGGKLRGMEHAAQVSSSAMCLVLPTGIMLTVMTVESRRTLKMVTARQTGQKWAHAPAGVRLVFLWTWRYTATDAT